jgi:hypothetical protein
MSRSPSTSIGVAITYPLRNGASWSSRRSSCARCLVKTRRVSRVRCARAELDVARSSSTTLPRRSPTGLKRAKPRCEKTACYPLGEAPSVAVSPRNLRVPATRRVLGAKSVWSPTTSVLTVGCEVGVAGAACAGQARSAVPLPALDGTS